MARCRRRASSRRRQSTTWGRMVSSATSSSLATIAPPSPADRRHTSTSRARQGFTASPASSPATSILRTTARWYSPAARSPISLVRLRLSGKNSVIADASDTSSNSALRGLTSTVDGASLDLENGATVTTSGGLYKGQYGVITLDWASGAGGSSLTIDRTLDEFPQVRDHFSRPERRHAFRRVDRRCRQPRTASAAPRGRLIFLYGSSTAQATLDVGSAAGFGVRRRAVWRRQSFRRRAHRIQERPDHDHRRQRRAEFGSVRTHSSPTRRTRARTARSRASAPWRAACNSKMARR